MTPQQANELLPCPFCGNASQLIGGEIGAWRAACLQSSGGCGALGRMTFDKGATAVKDWNRRAPAPTEPAVDRGLEAAAALVERKAAAYDAECGNTDPSTGTREYPGDGASWMMEMEELAEEIRALATPASPAVPEGTRKLIAGLEWELGETERAVQYWKAKAGAVQVVPGGTDAGARLAQFMRCAYPVAPEINARGYNWCEAWLDEARTAALAPQVPQASQPTSARDVMAGYTPKPPPPRPQRPVGAPWTDTEREEYRKNMKRGERCPDCSVIEGGQHFPGCSRGKL